jgi:probable rRNA maturation factor
MPVHIQNSQMRRVSTKRLREAAARVLRAEGAPDAEVSVLLIDDLAMRELNRTYRRQDTPTDVLSFAQRDARPRAPQPPPHQARQEVLGDVVISVETAARQADAHGLVLEDELALLAVHGILHLLGYDDLTEEAAAGMHARERVVLAESGAAPARGWGTEP